MVSYMCLLTNLSSLSKEPKCFRMRSVNSRLGIVGGNSRALYSTRRLQSSASPLPAISGIFELDIHVFHTTKVWCSIMLKFQHGKFVVKLVMRGICVHGQSK